MTCIFILWDLILFPFKLSRSEFAVLLVKVCCKRFREAVICKIYQISGLGNSHRSQFIQPRIYCTKYQNGTKGYESDSLIKKKCIPKWMRKGSNNKMFKGKNKHGLFVWTNRKYFFDNFLVLEILFSTV